MTIQLRQIALVAAKLEPVLQDLEAVFGLARAYIDPGVATFGLENTLMPVGRNFFEVVAPVQESTAAGRYLDRRGGDGGYMVITQTPTLAELEAVRAQAAAAGVRVAWESARRGWTLIQLHPGDLKTTFLDVEWDEHGDLSGPWPPAGGTGWEDKVRQDLVVDFTGVELQADDPDQAARLWSAVTGAPVDTAGGVPEVRLNNAVLKFVAPADGRGPGLSAVDLTVRDVSAILQRARARGLPAAGQTVEVCGVRFHLNTA
ncbi:MAG: VOC family protein [Alphaproteobacteria bacterium]